MTSPGPLPPPSPSATSPASQLPPPPHLDHGATKPTPPTPTAAEAESARTALSARQPTISDAWASVKAGDFLSVHQAPCSRDGFLTGIGSGAAVGALRFVLGSGVPKAANWAVGAGVLGAVLQYEYCQASRRRERENMKRVVEVYDKKQAEMRRVEEERIRQRRQKQVEEEEEARIKAQKSWWKVW
jgi:cytochrome c oxidase assembly protein subunit 20